MNTRTLRVALISSEDEAGLCASLARGFRDAGHDAHLIREPWLRFSRIVGPALAMQGRLPRWCVSDEGLLDSVALANPDLILVGKGTFVHPAVVHRLRALAPTVCWNPDSPFDSALSNHGGYLQPALPVYDAYITWSSSVALSIAELRDRVYVIPFGFDPHLHCPLPGSGKALGRVVLIGTASPERVYLLGRMRHLKPLVFGNGWPDEVGAEQPVFRSDLCKIAGEAAWCLNPLRPQNRDTHNMRSFELVACGAQQLTFDTADHQRFLGETSAVLVSTVDELVECAATTPPALRAKAVTADYTYKSRCEQLLRLLVSDALISADVIE